jgi:hypothetical protein
VVLGAASALVASALMPYPASGLALLLSMPLWRILLARGGRSATAA